MSNGQPQSAPQRRPLTASERRHARRCVDRLNGETAADAYERLSGCRHEEWEVGTPHVLEAEIEGYRVALLRTEYRRARERA